MTIIVFSNTGGSGSQNPHAIKSSFETTEVFNFFAVCLNYYNRDWCIEMVYIIGGNGFVGSAITRACQRIGMECAVLTRNNIDQFAGKACDILINANGNSKKYLADREPVWEFDASVRSVRASLANIKSERYIYLSSCDVYPDCSSPDSTHEDQYLEISKQSTYGFHKFLAEQCVIHCAPEWLIFRMGGFVGPGLKKNAIFDILHGGPLWLDPNSKLQFINVDVAADIILNLALSTHKNEIFNLCGTGVVALSEVIEATGSKIQINANSPTVHYEVDTRKICSICEIPSTRDAVLSYVKEQQTHG